MTTPQIVQQAIEVDPAFVSLRRPPLPVRTIKGKR